MTVTHIIVITTIAAVIGVPATATADPTPPPSPYQIPSESGPQFPGAQVYPPQCLRNMLPCGLRWDPSTGTWRPAVADNNG